jgi:gliding motility-associated-like protein
LKTPRLIALVTALLATALTHGQVTFQAVQTSGCAPFGVVINVTAPTSGITSYSWVITTPSGTQLTASNAQYVSIFNTPGTYDVSLTINGNQNQTLNDYITVYSRPEATFSVDDPSGCYPHCVEFTNTSVAGSGAITQINWDFGNGSTGNGSTANHCYTTEGNYSPVLNITDENGCFDTFLMSGGIQITDNFPTAAFTSTSFASCTSPATFNFQNSSTGNGALTSLWDFGNGQQQTVAGTAATSQTYTAVGTYPVCLTVMDAENCSSEVCHDVQLLSTPNPQFNVSATTICAGQGVTFTNTTTPAPTSFAWDFDGNGTIDSQAANPSFIYAGSGSYQPSLTVSYGPGCTATLANSITINVQNSLTATISASTTSGCTAPFTTSLTANVSGSGTFTYNWIIGGQSVGNTQTINHTFTNTGSFGVAVQITSSTGCSAALSQSNFITVQTPSVSFEAPTILCFDEPFIPENFTISGGATVASYSWDFNDDGIEDSNEASPSYSYTSHGLFSPTVTVTTSNGCTSTFTVPQPIAVQAPIIPTFSASNTVSCAGEGIQFCIPALDGNQYSWNFHDESGWITMAEDETCIEHIYEDTGYFDLSLSIISGACNLIDTLPNYIYIEPPVALFEFNVSCGDMLTVSVADMSIGAEGLSWDFGDGSAPVSNVTEYTHTYSTFGDYEITLTATSSTMSCPDDKTHTVNLAVPTSDVTFSTNTGCGPLPVFIQSTQWNSHWDVVVSNGYEIHVDYLLDEEQWQTVYIHDGEIDTSYVAYGGNFWPEMRFWYEGCYDFTINALNAYGCSSNAFYEDAVCVTSSFDFASFTIAAVDLCEDVSYTLIPNANNITSASWTFSDGGTSNDISPTHSFLPPFDYTNGITATVVATNSLGCISEVTQTVATDLPAIPSFTVPAGPFCQNSPIAFTNTSQGNFISSSWNFVDPGSGSSNTSNLTNPEHAFSANGIYEVCLTVTSANGCERTYCMNDGVEIANPAVSFTYNSNFNNCLMGVSFENTTPGNNTAFVWDFGDNQVGTGATTFHTYPLGVYDVSLTVTNILGCSATLVVPDILNFGDVIGPFSMDLDETPCAPFHVNLAAYNINDNSFSYFWDFNDGNGDPTGNTQVSHDYKQAGTYCPQLIMTDQNGCQVFVECQNPIVVENLTLAFEQPAAICAGETATIQIQNADNYEWSGGPVTYDEISNLYLLHPATTTQYTVTGTLDDCVTTEVITVTVNPLPVLALELPEYVCHQSEGFELVTGLPSGGAYFVDDIPTNFFNASLDPGIKSVRYEYTDGNGCSSEITSDVLIRALPEVTLAPINPVCEDAGALLFSGGLPLGGHYEFNGTQSTHFDTSVGAGNHSATYVYSDSFGCTNQASTPLVIHALPIAHVILNDVCQNIALPIGNLTSVSDGVVTESFWQFEDGPISFSFTPTGVYFDSPGQKTIHATFTSEHGCSIDYDTLIQVFHVPVSSFTLEDGCEQTQLTFQSTSTITEGEIVGWEWIFQNNSIIDDATILYSFTDWGVLPATLVVTSEIGCSDTLTQFVTVHPTPDIELNLEPICAGQVAYFNPDITLGAGIITDFNWEFDVEIEEPNTHNAEHLFENPGQYNISLEALTNLGCAGFAQGVLNVYPNPEIDFVVDRNTYCEGELIETIDLSSIDIPSSIVAWQWFVGDQEVDNSQNASFYFNQAGLWDITLRATSNHGCTSDSTMQQHVQIHPKPVAGFNIANNEVTMLQPVVVIENASSLDVTAWLYDFGDGNLSSYSEGPHEYDVWGDYVITQIVANTFGCADTTYRNVTVDPELLFYFPNAFTPDGNGNNDVFKPSFYGSDVLQYEFTIFDRWGKIVFTTTDVEGCWDGSIKGVEAQDGVYNWIMKYRSTDDPILAIQQGSVTLLR